MAAFIAWLKSKNITTHTIAALGISAAGLITFDPQVQQFVLTLLKAHPALAGDIIILAGIVAKYSHSSSPAGTVANAKAIMALPNAPTAAQVDSASQNPTR